MSLVQQRLREFKLAGMAANFAERLAYAQQQTLGYSSFLELLLEDEANSRKANSYKKRYHHAKFPAHKTLEDNVVFIGNPGTGKTHLAIALGIQALQKEYKVLFTSVADMLYHLHAAKADNSYYKRMNDYLAPDLLILDELGFKKLPNYSGDDFFEIIARRYEKGSLIITTNKPFEQWSEIVADTILANAVLDRIVHHSTVFKITGPSYRTKDIKQSGESV